MERRVDMSEISDGRLYGLNDMVRAGCNDCMGCSACCRGMGNSLQLDPCDIYRLCLNTNQNFEQLLTGPVELGVADGIIMPNIKMSGDGEACGFLNTEGRCSIHAFRPGICRLFPLGRYYDNGTFQYFLQIHECRNQSKSKVKVKKWIDTPDIDRYEKFITDWHYYLKNVQEHMNHSKDEEAAKKYSMYILKEFYIKPYQKVQDFYSQFEERLAVARNWKAL